MTTLYSPSPAFNEAASYLSSAPSLAQVTNSVKLELYGLFKLLTVAPSPNTSRPSFFDISGRAKWDAWKLAAETYEGRPSDAELRYLDIARSLGWKEGSPSTMTTATAAATEETEEPAERSGGGGTGMGVSVSVMSQPPEDEQAMGLHSYAMGDDVAALSAFLQASQDPDVDARDEYGYTALHLAADRGNISAVELLLKHGADKTLKDADEYTAVDLATIAQHPDIVALLERT